MATSDSMAQGTPAPVAVKTGTLEALFTVRAATPEEIAQGKGPNIYTTRYTFDRLAADGVICDVRSGEVFPDANPTRYFSGAQANSQKALLDAYWAKIQTTI